MRAVYVDTSCLVAIAFEEPGWSELAEKLLSYQNLVSSNLLEAELRAAIAREGLANPQDENLLSGVSWILPNRSLASEFRRILAQGYSKGADLWHLACALFLARDPENLPFATLDERQKQLAENLGFPVVG